MKINYYLSAISIIAISTFSAAGQNVEEILNRGEIRGNFQIDSQYYEEDSLIGAEDVPEKIRYNGFLNLIYTNGDFSAGVRYESYEKPLLGFPPDYEGSGIAYRYVSFTKEKLSVTVGNFYEQFGNGMTFRTYEERGLGYDNAMDGIRLKYHPTDGVTLTAITGKQRLFFEYGEGVVRGFDGEVYLNETFKRFKDSKTKVIIGGSAVSKFEADQNDQLVLPENVSILGSRININRGRLNFNGEYAYKINDPSVDNGFIYRHGEALFLQTSYSQKGLGIVLAAKRNDNMSFRSERNQDQQNLLINYLPALTKQHTYNLLATLYPYAVQLNGEVAFQADLIYKFKKGTVLGGKRGMDIQLNYSTANNIDTTLLNDEETDRQGYKSDYFKVGEIYFKDFNLTLTKKLSSKVKGSFTYANLVYNQDIIEGKPGAPLVYANIGIADVTYKFTTKNSLRTEIQGLFTKQDNGDWVTVLFEYTMAPHWFVAVLDQYNVGSDNAIQKSDFGELLTLSKFQFRSPYNYYNFSAGYNNGGNRISLSYGRQRAGIFCVGGVCRVVPASSGLFLSVTSSF